MTARFYPRRVHTKGAVAVQTGFRDGGLLFRVKFPQGTTVSLTYTEATDLADALDAALDEQDGDPLL